MPRQKPETSPDLVRRITRLFDARGRLLSLDEACEATAGSPDWFDSLVADGTIGPPVDGRLVWDDVAYVAAQVRWTPRLIATALRDSHLRHMLPRANRYTRVEFALPAYQWCLLSAAADLESEQRGGFGASDVLERIVADHFEGELAGVATPDQFAEIRAALRWPVGSSDD